MAEIDCTSAEWTLRLFDSEGRELVSDERGDGWIFKEQETDEMPEYIKIFEDDGVVEVIKQPDADTRMTFDGAYIEGIIRRKLGPGVGSRQKAYLKVEWCLKPSTDTDVIPAQD